MKRDHTTSLNSVSDIGDYLSITTRADDDEVERHIAAGGPDVQEWIDLRDCRKRCAERQKAIPSGRGFGWGGKGANRR